MVADVRSAYVGTARRAGAGAYPKPTETCQSAVERPPFSMIEVVPFDQVVARSAEELIGLELSNSYSTPAQLGERREPFEVELRRALLTYDPSGQYEETIRTEALIATR
ncbi:hypothetical protein OHA98_21360 [Streptomyces sp. NBC_00654]|uniref:hypothetical protein n=1 Tax=Streptomyces sp. NBC_00654 TaxID=2975799 RepID=UPI00225A514A|nr:hypothetical protein [Streptomyces sp. NBC_00654]MCX4967267.1 hypothetical protein [Streptomyces sp. NBC_00654]